MAVLEIAVYTDTICPWCYIAHKTLDRGIELYQRTYPGGRQDCFNFTFLPYYLDVNAPTKGIPWEERVAQKNGKDAVNAIRTRLQRVGRASGIEFSFNSTIGKTRDCHRLLKWAKLNGGEADAQKRLLKAIFEWHFERNGDITDRQGLIDAAVVIGLPEAEVRRLLESDDCGAWCDEEAARARAHGVNSVPTIEINGKRVEVEGAGDPSEFLEAIIDARRAIPDEN